MNRYISKIRLENFQSYKDETIELKPGLNLILGSSDSGKSAILRAISFVLYNSPKSKTLIHQGATEVRVSIEYSDKTIVTRIRGDRNTVMVAMPNGELKVWDKIENDLPDEVKNIMGNPPYDDFNGPIAYADQFSKMFLVDLSPTDLPRSLSSLTGIEILEQSAKELMQSYKAIEKQTKLEEKDLLKLLNEQQLYNAINNADNELKNANNNLECLTKSYEELEELLNYSVENNSVSIELVNEYEAIIDSLNQSIRELYILNGFNIIIDGLRIFELVAKDLIGVDINDINLLLNYIIEIEKQIYELKEKNTVINSLNDINSDYKDIRDTGNVFSDEYKSDTLKLKEMELDLSDFKKMLIENNIQCDKCGSILA